MRLPMVFLDGPWRHAMGLNALDPADWLWFDEAFEQELAEKRRLLTERRDQVYDLLPGAEGAAAELLALLVDHLPAHHPDRFAPDAASLVVRATGERVGADAPEPLLVASLLVQEDLCLMAGQADGSYTLIGASLCFPMRWRLADKLGRPMRAIHAPVPGFAERLAGPADRFFEAIEPDRPVWRANWSLTDVPDLFQPDTRKKPMTITAKDAGDRLHLRVERQTLRRLAQSRCVVFTIRTLVRRLGEIAAEPGVAAALGARIREMPEPMLAYKNVLGVRAALLDWLDAAAERSVGSPRAQERAAL